MIYNAYIFMIEVRNGDIDRGIVFADSYENAVSKFIEYYGENNIVNIKIELLDESSIPILHTTETIENELKTYYGTFV